MQRYSNIRRENNKLKTIKFPKIVPSEKDIIIISRTSDRIDLLAEQYYGDQTLYWIIALASNLGKGSVEIPPGTTVRIPNNYISIVGEYNKLNS